MDVSPELFRRFVTEQADYAILLIDADGVVRFWNRGAERLFGWEAHEAVGRTADFIFTEEDRAAGIPEAEIRQACERGLAPDERWHVRKDGSRFFANGVLSRLAEADGRVICLSKILRDDTARHMAQREAEEAEERFQLILDRVQEYAIFLMDAHGLVTHWGAGAERMKRWKEADILGKHLSVLYPEGGAEDGTAEEHLRQAARDGEYVGEGTRLRGDGELFTARATLTALRRDGELVGFSKVTHDLTQQRKYEAAIEASEHRYKQLVEAMPQLVFVTDASGTPDLANARLERYVGVPVERWSEAVHPADIDRVRAMWGEAMRTGEGFDLEMRVKRAADGTYRWFLLHVVPLVDGELVGWMGSCTDVQERMDNEAALRQAQKLESIGVLAGGIAHDFNNLLTGILGNATLARRRAATADPTDLERRLDDVIRAAERAAQLTRQLLAYAGRGRLFVEPIDVCAILDETGELLRTSTSHRVELDVDVERDCPPVLADATQIQQLLMNLVINASEAIGDAGGRVRLRAFSRSLDEAEASAWVGHGLSPGRYVTLCVQDQGVGMDDETLGRIFDPFFTTKFTGRGLGLAAALGIVKGHRGAIRVDSEPGRGTTFEVLLPAADARIAVKEAVQPARQDVRGRVLVVDDEDYVRETVSEILVASGFDVVTAANGRDAIDHVATSDRFDAVVLDLTMPVMSGDQALPELRALDPRLPIVVASGYGEAETLARFDGRVQGFVQKPFTDDRLVAAVEGAIVERRRQR